jgi:hypothetical protein
MQIFFSAGGSAVAFCPETTAVETDFFKPQTVICYHSVETALPQRFLTAFCGPFFGQQHDLALPEAVIDMILSEKAVALPSCSEDLIPQHIRKSGVIHLAVAVENFDAQHPLIEIQHFKHEFLREVTPCGVVDDNAAAVGYFQRIQDFLKSLTPRNGETQREISVFRHAEFAETVKNACGQHRPR